MWRLLRKNVSATQMMGFAIANLIGLSIVIVAIQFYSDVRPVFEDDESFIRKDYLIITKQVSGMGSLMGDRSEFSDDDINDLKSQKWVRKVGQFTTSDYGIYASVGFANGGRELHTQFFFESIPDEFLDVDPSGWKFDPAHPVVPVIVSKDYLSLYNFGFAAAQGMPQISESMIGMVPISFTFTGNGLRETIPGKIVGFSNRLNTIIVPADFMKWSNYRYSIDEKISPSRLIVEVNNPGDTQIKQYMDRNEYEIAGDKADSSKANYFLTVIISIVIAIGIVISILSFFVLLLSIYLLLQKNTQKLQNLLLLGYSPKEVSRPYMMMVVYINLVVLVGSVALMFVARMHYMPMLAAFDLTGSNVCISIITAAVLMSIITIGNVVAIYKKINSLWLNS